MPRAIALLGLAIALAGLSGCGGRGTSGANGANDRGPTTTPAPTTTRTPTPSATETTGSSAVQPPPSRTKSNGARPVGGAARSDVTVSVELDDARRIRARGDVLRGRLVVTNTGAGALRIGDGKCTIDAGLFFDGERETAPLDCRDATPATPLRPGERRELAFELPVAAAGGAALAPGAYDLFVGPLVPDERTGIAGALWGDAVQVVVPG